jgi:ergothioneine biosynthesis protein EgtB
MAARSANPLEEDRERILKLYARTRARTEELAARLSPEDQQLQSMSETSPAKWHRAHTTWFFEVFALEPEGVPAFDARYAFLFNSYYETVGPRQPRPLRGMLSRPSAAEVTDYRREVDDRTLRLIAGANSERLARLLPILELGIAHEEQHQELLLTDIHHAFAASPLRPTYHERAGEVSSSAGAPPARFVGFEGGLYEIGAPDGVPFCFDNERPRHKTWVEPFALADRLLTVSDLRAFVQSGGYKTPSLWLSDGFDLVRAQALSAPLYVSIEDGELTDFTLEGLRCPEDHEPMAHVSFYEADAVARFMGARLPTEAEWEVAAVHASADGNLGDPRRPDVGNFADDEVLRPLAHPVLRAPGIAQLFGDAWEWTSSSYDPYPGYAAPPGAIGEYNGKFMVSQKVLRGGSCLTPRRHVRASYRNFWHPATRFQMTGVRLARDA